MLFSRCARSHAGTFPLPKLAEVGASGPLPSGAVPAGFSAMFKPPVQVVWSCRCCRLVRFSHAPGVPDQCLDHLPTGGQARSARLVLLTHVPAARSLRRRFRGCSGRFSTCKPLQVEDVQGPRLLPPCEIPRSALRCHIPARWRGSTRLRLRERTLFILTDSAFLFLRHVHAARRGYGRRCFVPNPWPLRLSQSAGARRALCSNFQNAKGGDCGIPWPNSPLSQWFLQHVYALLYCLRTEPPPFFLNFSLNREGMPRIPRIPFKLGD